MDKVFVTHSKHDAPILAHIRKLVNIAGVTPVFYQYDPRLDSCAWEEIRDEIAGRGALFVVLSNNLSSSSHTQNWVGFEVGLAGALRKPTWVFEEMYRRVSFPIPYLTDYLPYNLNDPQLQSLVTSAASSYNLQRQRQGFGGGAVLGGIIGGLGGPPGVLIGAVIGSAVGQASNRPIRPPFVPLMCYHIDCKTRFNLYVMMRDFECPACRRPLRFSIQNSPNGVVHWVPSPQSWELRYPRYCWFDGSGHIRFYEPSILNPRLS